MATTMIALSRAADFAVAEAFLHATMHGDAPAPVRAALVVRAVVRRTSPTCARIGMERGRLVFPAAMWGGGGRPS